MEVVIKHLKNPDEMERTGSAFYKECLDSDYYNFPLKPKHAMLIDLIDSGKHKDPFDKALLAQAKQENMYLVTCDEKLHNYIEPCVILV
jgi:PIN domain nuclease of toxin-antitoxin system